MNRLMDALKGKGDQKGLLQRSGIIVTIAVTFMELAREIIPLWVQDPKLEKTLVLTVTSLTAALLTAFGNPSKRAGP